MIDGLRIQVEFNNDEPGFTAGRSYDVLHIEGGKFLLVNDSAGFAWVDPTRATASTITRGNERWFDLAASRLRQRLQTLIGRPVLLTTWENLGFDPDEVSDESMLLYRGVVDSYDGETLFLRRYDAEQSRFGVLPRAIATIEEEKA